MYIDSIENGIVLDHITAGRGMRVYETLGLDALDCTVAILKNVPSGKMGRKDIIKIGAQETASVIFPNWVKSNYITPPHLFS